MANESVDRTDDVLNELVTIAPAELALSQDDNLFDDDNVRANEHGDVDEFCHSLLSPLGSPPAQLDTLSPLSDCPGILPVKSEASPLPPPSPLPTDICTAKAPPNPISPVTDRPHASPAQYSLIFDPRFVFQAHSTDNAAQVVAVGDAMHPCTSPTRQAHPEDYSPSKELCNGHTVVHNMFQFSSQSQLPASSATHDFGFKCEGTNGILQDRDCNDRSKSSINCETVMMIDDFLWLQTTPRRHSTNEGAPGTKSEPLNWEPFDTQPAIIDEVSDANDMQNLHLMIQTIDDDIIVADSLKDLSASWKFDVVPNDNHSTIQIKSPRLQASTLNSSGSKRLYAGAPSSHAMSNPPSGMRKRRMQVTEKQNTQNREKRQFRAPSLRKTILNNRRPKQRQKNMDAQSSSPGDIKQEPAFHCIEKESELLSDGQSFLSVAYQSSSCTPSRFCHICTRATKPEEVVVCGNVKKGTCRKIICYRCMQEIFWDWGSAAENENWECTHCRKACPTKAQCYTYRRVNQNRRSHSKRSRNIAHASPQPNLVDKNERSKNRGRR